MRIAIANDHRGIKAKELIKALLEQLRHNVIDFGTDRNTPVDYPDMAYIACSAVIDGRVDRAILICGTGICMSIAANKVRGIRAALCYDELDAQLSREHNDANALCLAGDLVGEIMLRKIVEKWLTTSFAGGRHLRRIKKIKAIEDGLDPREIKM